MLFVFTGKLVSVAQYDLPLAVFTAVGLWVQRRSWTLLTSPLNGPSRHVATSEELPVNDLVSARSGSLGDGNLAAGGPLYPPG